jgi:hypothetical protein
MRQGDGEKRGQRDKGTERKGDEDQPEADSLGEKGDKETRRQRECYLNNYL